MEKQLVEWAVQVQGPGRRETLMGQEFRVVPATLVKSQVLQNNLGATYLPPEDVTQEWADQANGAPVLTDHPTRNGSPVSGRDPDVLNGMGVGFLFRTRAANGALEADVFLDESRADEVADLAVILGKLDAKETVELSTGWPAAVDNVAGTINGAKYEKVIHPLGFDHLAVFAAKVGACSVSDGCGLVANHDGECQVEPAEEDTEQAAVQMEGTHEADGIWYRRLFDALRRAIFGQNESDEDRRRVLSAALREQFGDDDTFLFIDSVFSEEGQVVYEVEGGDAPGLFRVDFEVADDGSVTLSEPVAVRRVTTFEPVTNTGDNREDGGTMNRDQMIAHLAEAGTDRAALEALSDCQLQALVGAGDGQTATNQPEPQGDGWGKAREWREKFERLQAETRNAVARESEERTQLLDDILYLKHRPWSDEEVQNMELPQLRKVHAALVGNRADYSGRGGPRTDTGPNLSFVQPILGGARGQSVLDKGEVN